MSTSDDVVVQALLDTHARPTRRTRAHPDTAAVYGAPVAGRPERVALRRVQAVLPVGRSPRESIAASLG